MINYVIIVWVFGIFFLIIGMLMWIGIFFFWYFEFNDLIVFFWLGFICIIMGGMMWLLKFCNDCFVCKCEGYFIVVLGWFMMSFFGMLFYLLSGVIFGVFFVIFEMVFGMIMMGVLVFIDIEV